MSFIRVALDVPVTALFDYRAVDASRHDVGRRVLVPFGNRIAVGVVMEFISTTSLPPRTVRDALRVLRDVPSLPADILALLRFCSDYYHHPLGSVVLNALPTRLRRRYALKLGHTRYYRLSAVGERVEPATLPARAVTKHALLNLLRSTQTALSETALRTVAPRAAVALKAMLAAGWVEPVAGTGAAAVSATRSASHNASLSTEQRAAVDAVSDSAKGFVPWLLQGITGSGKTEVYLELIATALARGLEALLLVPEINLTPQMESRVRERFPGMRLVVLHSRLNESERLQAWMAAQSGDADIILGTRLAVFTPIPRLGLIIVDEEHDASFKQTEGLRYSARDIALLRAKQCAIPIVLGSATPSLESFHQAQSGRYHRLVLEHRFNAALPYITCVDTRGEPLIEGLSQVLLAAVRDSLQRGEQSLIFINRRGYAPVLYCAGCGWIPGCSRCTAKLVLHLKDRRMRCHHCGHQRPVPAACPQCGNQQLQPLGQGTQRIENALTRIFPKARLLRIDRDSTSQKHAWQDMRRRIHAHEVDILVGTQIVAKGHDFPRLTLVGVLNADNSLYSTDFRAGERLFSGLTQVAGRAGRAERPGRVLIQTGFPEHPLYQALRRHDYSAFASELLAERKQAALPPYAYLAVLRAEASRPGVALEFLGDAARIASAYAERVTVYDPVPAAMPRLAGRERAQLMVQSRSRTALQTFLRQWYEGLVNAGKRHVRWALDVDPQEL